MKKKWKIYGMLFIATATWGSAFIAGEIAVQSFEPAQKKELCSSRL
jgi:hypothetical protein